MRSRELTLALLSLSLIGIGVVTGCGGGKETEAIIEQTEETEETEAIIEPTEETEETEAIEPTEETLEITDETYPGFSSENITINSDGKVTDYNEAFIKECRNYHMFDECNDEEVKEVLQSVIEEAIGSSERTPSLYHAIISSMDESGVNGREFLSSGTSSSKDNSSTSGNKSNSNSNSNSASTSNNTQSNSNASTPSQDTDKTKGYGDAGGNNTSEAPVQSVDDGFGDESNTDMSQFFGQTDYGENTGGTIDLQ